MLKAYLFESLEQVRVVAYNEEGPHDALKGLPPSLCRKRLEADISTGPQEHHDDGPLFSRDRDGEAASSGRSGNCRAKKWATNGPQRRSAAKADRCRLKLEYGRSRNQIQELKGVRFWSLLQMALISAAVIVGR